jgi:hypothetical protein
MNPTTTIRLLYGVATFFGIIALVALFSGSVGGCLGVSVFSLAFTAFGWATRRLGCPREGESPGGSIGLVVLVIFGGAGVVTVIGSFFLIAERGAEGLLLTVFGLIFCGGGYLGKRAFTPPEGTQQVLVGESTSTSHGGRQHVRRQQYVLVDERMPAAEVQAKQQEWAEKPWTQREDWAAGAIQQEDKLDLRLLVGFAIAWNIISGVIVGGVLASSGFGGFALILLGFPAFGIALVVLAIRTWLRRRRFGPSVLRCPTVPVWLGEQLRGVVETNIASTHRSRQGFRVRLACLRERTYHGRRNDDRTTMETVWEREEDAHAPDDGAPLVRIPIDVTVPASLPPTVMPPSDDRTLWRVTISQKLPGIDYHAVFEIPVFRK